MSGAGRRARRLTGLSEEVGWPLDEVGWVAGWEVRDEDDPSSLLFSMITPVATAPPTMRAVLRLPLPSQKKMPRRFFSSSATTWAGVWFVTPADCRINSVRRGGGRGFGPANAKGLARGHQPKVGSFRIGCGLDQGNGLAVDGQPVNSLLQRHSAGSAPVRCCLNETGLFTRVLHFHLDIRQRSDAIGIKKGEFYFAAFHAQYGTFRSGKARKTKSDQCRNKHGSKVHNQLRHQCGFTQNRVSPLRFTIYSWTSSSSRVKS
jgi:hypothetical protein